jgi:hypothetical protein
LPIGSGHFGANGPIAPLGCFLNYRGKLCFHILVLLSKSRLARSSPPLDRAARNLICHSISLMLDM